MMGHLFEAVAWLANFQGTQDAHLKCDIILTGSVTPVIGLDSFTCHAKVWYEWVWT